MERVKYEDRNYVKIERQWYWDTWGDLVPVYGTEEILDSLVSGSDMPTEAERERLVILMEECGEVIQAASKILRHGWKSQYVDGELNVDRLRDELDDVNGIVWAMEQSGEILGPYTSVSEVWERKKGWMQWQE